LQQHVYLYFISIALRIYYSLENIIIVEKKKSVV